MTPPVPLIQTTGDLEVVVLYEAHDLLADLISSEYYRVVGAPPSEIRFHSSSATWNFFLHVHELIAPGPNLAVNGMRQLSLIAGLIWLCQTHRSEAEAVGLDRACAALDEWLRTERRVTFWCSDVDADVSFVLSRATLIKFAANLSKHRLLRLSSLMHQLRTLAVASGLTVDGTQLVALREPFIEQIQGRLIYLSSWLVELLGDVWLSLNELVCRRYASSATNRVSEMRIPDGVTSDAIRNLYGATLVFQSYAPERITKHVPRTPEVLKLRY